MELIIWEKATYLQFSVVSWCECHTKSIISSPINSFDIKQDFPCGGCVIAISIMPTNVTLEQAVTKVLEHLQWSFTKANQSNTYTKLSYNIVLKSVVRKLYCKILCQIWKRYGNALFATSLSIVYKYGLEKGIVFVPKWCVTIKRMAFWRYSIQKSSSSIASCHKPLKMH